MSESADHLGPMPAGLANAFPEAVEGLLQYASSLATDGVIRGLIGPREVPRLWERHIGNCAAIQELLPAGASVIDVGSGAGLPGIVLALVRPDVQMTIIEPLLRRTTYLEEVVTSLGLAARVRVLRGRAQDYAGRESADVVTSRAVTNLADLLDWCWPLVAPQGGIVAIKGANAGQELADASAALAARGIAAAQAQVRDCRSSAGEATAVVISRTHPPR